MKQETFLHYKGVFKVYSWRKNQFGYTAVIGCNFEGTEIYKSNPVKLYDSRDREKVLTGFFKAIPRDKLPEEERAKFLKAFEPRLREIDDEIATREEEKAKKEISTDQPPPMTEEDRSQALAFLNDPALLERTRQDLTTMGIVGEDNNKVLVYAIATSRKMNDPLGATVKATSSSGKNNLIGKVASLMPEEDVRDFSYLSGKALLHVRPDWAKHKLLMITEVVGKEQAEYLIRVFQSEKKLKSAITIREYESGPLKVEEKEVEGPAAYLDTTTSFDIHPENATRIFEIYLDESKEQTEAIIQLQFRESGIEMFKIEAEREQIKKIHQNAQRLLKSGLVVIIPYNKLLKFPADDVRARRDCSKLLGLIRVIAFFHQHQRPIHKSPDGQEYIEAELIDYDLAYHLAKQTFIDTLDDLDKRSRQVFDQVRQSRQETDPYSWYTFDRDEVAEICHTRKNKLIQVFDELEQKEYFLDPSGDPIQQKGTAKREYKINQEKAKNNKFVIDQLITPEELRKVWEAARTEEDASGPTLSPLSPLSQA